MIFVPAPAGLHNAICVGAIDLGVQLTGYGSKSQIMLSWELDAQMEDGNRFVLSRRFSASLSKQGALRPLLESWRGRAFTPEELKAFDLKNVLGKGCQLLVQHSTSQDGAVFMLMSRMRCPPQKEWT